MESFLWPYKKNFHGILYTDVVYNLMVIRRSNTSIGVDFVQRIFIGRQHAHVGSEFLHEDIHHFLRGGSARHADTFCHHIGPILEVKPHHSVELTRL